MKSLNRTSGGLLFAATMLWASQASAFCISFGNRQPIPDMAFVPLVLEFSINPAAKWDSAIGQSTVSQSFKQTVVLDSAALQSEDFCNEQVFVDAHAKPGGTLLTAEISDRAGRDFSDADTRVRLSSTDTGFATRWLGPGFSVSYATHRVVLDITASSFVPVWDEALDQYVYASYFRSLSIGDWGLEGYYGGQLSLESYLRSKIQAGTFGYVERVSISGQDYVNLDNYGYEGTATLLSVTQAVPEAPTLVLFLMGLGLLIARRGGRPH